MMFDERCYELAAHFMAEDETPENKSKLAQMIQDTVEDWVTVDGYLDDADITTKADHASINARAAREVMGWRVDKSGDGSGDCYFVSNYPATGEDTHQVMRYDEFKNAIPFDPEHDIADAWLVVGRMRKLNAPVYGRFVSALVDTLIAKHGGPEPEVGYAPTELELVLYFMEPEDICLAALEAVK